MTHGIPHLLGKLPAGESGIRKTLKVMRHMVRQCKTDPELRKFALNLVRHLPQRDYNAEVRTLHAWVRDHIRYVRDVTGVETIQTPRQILSSGQSDCDEKSLLLAVFLETLGHPTRFAALGYGDHPTHVLVETKVGNSWVPLETTEPVEAGWYPDRIRRRIVIYNGS